MKSEKDNDFAIIIPREKIINANGEVSLVANMIASNRQTEEKVAEILAKQIDGEVVWIDKESKINPKSFNLSSAFENGSCRWEPKGPKLNWEIRSKTNLPKDPRVN